MTNQEFEKGKEKTEKETLIISRVEEGLKVYAAAAPKNSYIVSGSPEAPSCTCPDFAYHAGDPQWRCRHILAALSQLYKLHAENCRGSFYEDQERKAFQEGARQTSKAEGETDKASSPELPTGNGTSHMLIKRSISPDGRIDSLSVEFACPVEKIPVKEIKERALKTLQLQSDIVETFLKGKKHGNGKDARPVPDSDGAIPATLLSVGGMDGKWGRRLFITVKANGLRLRLFGSKKQLGGFLTTAGLAHLAGRIAEDLVINAACRIVTKPSQNGKYTDVAQVLPARRRNQ